MMILKLCAMALIGILIITLIRIYKPEFTVEAILCASLLLLLLTIDSVKYSLTSLSSLYEQMTYGTTYFPIILKALGIAYVTEFTAAICQDAGEKSIAGKVELAGKIAIFFLALPIFTSLLDLLDSLI